MLKYQRPQTSEKDIPHRTTLRTAIMERAELVKERIAEEFGVRSCYVLITQPNLCLGCSWGNLDYIRLMDV